MKKIKYKIASILMIIHGGFMELFGCLMLLFILLSGMENINISSYFTFINPYFQDNLYLMAAMGGLYGVIRIIGAVGLLKNRMWGLVLSVINCIVTINLVAIMLPAGIIDGIFASISLILILTEYYGKRKVDGNEVSKNIFNESLKGND